MIGNVKTVLINYEFWYKTKRIFGRKKGERIGHNILFIYEEDLKIIVAYMHVCIFPKTVESLTSFTWHLPRNKPRTQLPGSTKTFFWRNIDHQSGEHNLLPFISIHLSTHMLISGSISLVNVYLNLSIFLLCMQVSISYFHLLSHYLFVHNKL